MSFIIKHEPQVWSDLVFENPHVERTLRRYAFGQKYGNIILHGPKGSGKSVTARMIAASSYGKKLADAELDILDFKDDIDTRLAAWAEGQRWGYYMTQNNTQRVYAICNEVDLYSNKQQATLRALLDDPYIMKFGRFILTTNHQNKVDQPLVDRCSSCQVLVPTPDQFAPRAQKILADEGIGLDLDVIQSDLFTQGKSLRQALDHIENIAVDAKANIRSI